MHSFFNLTYFREVGQKYRNIGSFVGSNEDIQKSFWNWLTFNLCLQSKRRRKKNLTNWEILCCKNRIIDNAGRSKNVRNFGGKESLKSKMYTLLILVDFAKIDLVYLAIKKCQGWEKQMSSCDKITTTWIQVSRQKWNGFFPNASHHI